MTTHIKDILKTFIDDKKKEYSKKENIEKIIRSVLGADLAAKVRADTIYRKNLLLLVDNSGVRYEVYLRKKELLERIKKQIPKIGDIKIKVG